MLLSHIDFSFFLSLPLSLKSSKTNWGPSQGWQQLLYSSPAYSNLCPNPPFTHEILQHPWSTLFGMQTVPSGLPGHCFLLAHFFLYFSSITLFCLFSSVGVPMSLPLPTWFHCMHSSLVMSFTAIAFFLCHLCSSLPKCPVFLLPFPCPSCPSYKNVEASLPHLPCFHTFI